MFTEGQSLFCSQQHSTSEEAGAAQEFGQWHSWESWPHLTQGTFHTTRCHAQHIKLRGDWGMDGAPGEAGHQLVGGVIALICIICLFWVLLSSVFIILCYFIHWPATRSTPLFFNPSWVGKVAFFIPSCSLLTFGLWLAGPKHADEPHQWNVYLALGCLTQTNLGLETATGK